MPRQARISPVGQGSRLLKEGHALHSNKTCCSKGHWVTAVHNTPAFFFLFWLLNFGLQAQANTKDALFEGCMSLHESPQIAVQYFEDLGFEKLNDASFGRYAETKAAWMAVNDYLSKGSSVLPTTDDQRQAYWAESIKKISDLNAIGTGNPDFKRMQKDGIFLRLYVRGLSPTDPSNSGEEAFTFCLIRLDEAPPDWFRSHLQFSMKLKNPLVISGTPKPDAKLEEGTFIATREIRRDEFQQAFGRYPEARNEIVIRALEHQS